MAEEAQLLPTETFCSIASSLFQQVPYILYVLSVPGYRFTYANQAQVYLLHDPHIQSPRDLLGKHPWDVFPYWRETVMPVYEEVRISKSPRHLRDIAFKFTWGTNYRDMSIIPNIDANTDSVTSITTLTIDITDRRLAEEELRTSEEKYRSITESAPLAIIAADADGNVIS